MRASSRFSDTIEQVWANPAKYFDTEKSRYSYQSYWHQSNYFRPYGGNLHIHNSGWGPKWPDSSIVPNWMVKDLKAFGISVHSGFIARRGANSARNGYLGDLVFLNRYEKVDPDYQEKKKPFQEADPLNGYSLSDVRFFSPIPSRYGTFNPRVSAYIHKNETKVAIVSDLDVVIRLFGLSINNGKLKQGKRILANIPLFMREKAPKEDELDYFEEHFFFRKYQDSLGEVVPLSDLGALCYSWRAAFPRAKVTGVSKLSKVVDPVLVKATEEGQWDLWFLWQSFLRKSSKTLDKVRVSKLLNQTFAEVKTPQDIRDIVEPFICKGSTEEILASLPFYKGFRKEAVKKATQRAIVKKFAEAEELEIDKEEYPLFHEAVVTGEIPLSIFFPPQKEESYFLINSQWDLWEEMLTRFPEETKKIARNASSRKHYEKNLSSYFYFVLHKLPEYLKEQTGYNWTCSPRLVESQYELEPQAVDEDRGVTKKRSALTPVADNTKHHVVVPYASMAVYGRMTTWCYALNYDVLRRGLAFNGEIVTKDVEKKLNGKDDYGLMFYTLTGSATNRGYPTFLIIFERLKQKGKTRVHFHRVHPMRSKGGDHNPVHNWTKTAYNWMIGNVNRNDIVFQQGDLAFIQVTSEKAARVDFSGGTKVTDCDSHCFETPVAFVADKSKDKNVLGYIRLDGDNMLRHPEHDDVPVRGLGDKVLQIRQCRSWEANPKGVWTLNID